MPLNCKRYKCFEKALYGTIQRHDESHDSYLGRMESNFVELLSKGTKLESRPICAFEAIAPRSS